MTASDSLPCGVAHTDGSGTILRMNAELLRTIGAAGQRPPGTLIDEIMPPASRIFLQTHLWPMLLRDGQVREIYLHLRGAGSARIPVMVNVGTARLDEQPCFIWVMFVAHERSRFETELIKARDRSEANIQVLAGQHHFVRALAEASGRGMAYFDLSARCRFANERFACMVGCSVAGLQDSRWHMLFDALTCARHQLAFEAALQGASAAGLALTLAAAGGADWRAAYLPSRDGGGVVDGCFMVEQSSGAPCG